jgi:pseudaminic acid cytidylyltransferase
MQSQNKTRIAVIPARGGSKRIPHKNRKLFHGKPIIAYSIECAESSGLFDKIHISTEDKEIYNIASNFGYKPDFMRPQDLADDNTPIMKVLKYTLEKYESLGMFFEEIMLIMACAPLIRPEDLQSAVQLYQSNPNASGIVGVSKFPAPINRSYRLSSQSKLEAEFPEKMKERSQDLPDHYFDAGQFSLFSVLTVKKSAGAGDYQNLIGFIIPPERAIDIDKDEDWSFAEKLFNNIV